MAFIDWDPLARGGVFGAIFLVALVVALWIWYQTSVRPGADRWTWRIGITVVAALTAPAVILGLANLDSEMETLLTIFAWTCIGAGVASLLLGGGFAIWGRPAPVPAYVPPPSMPAPVPSPEPWPTATAAAPAPARPSGPVYGYLLVKAGPEKGRQFPLPDSSTIGRNADQCSIPLDDRRVSRVHAQVKRSGGQFVFTDLQSGNGSFLRVEGREEQIRAPQVLVDGDEVRVGATVFEFVDTATGRRR